MAFISKSSPLLDEETKTNNFALFFNQCVTHIYVYGKKSDTVTYVVFNEH